MTAQSMAALEVANTVRLERAQLHRDIAADDTRELAYGTIVFTPPCCKNARVLELLRWIPRIQTFRAMKVCARANVGEGRRLGDLTDRERTALVTELRAA